MTKALLDTAPNEPLVASLSEESISRSNSIRSQIVEAIKDKRIVSPDLKFPERDFAEAPNFLTWCTDKAFLGQNPFVAQAVIATNVFADYCPRCTDNEWFLNGWRAGDTLSKFRRKVALLDKGVCPHCGANRAELVASGELNFYNEGAISAGQRCVVGDTQVLTPDGLVSIDSFAEGRPVGFSPLEASIWNGDAFEKTTHFFIAQPESVYEVILRDGSSITGTVDHPLMTKVFGWMRIGDLMVGDTIVVQHDSTYGDSQVASIRHAGTQATYDFTLPETHQFIANNILSHNSGKSALIGMMSSYSTHKLLKMDRPIQIYGVMRGQYLHGTFVALTYAQAKDTLWDPYYSALLESVWFQQYHEALDFVNSRYGDELYQLRDTFVKYRHRGIYFYPAGPDKRVLRGRTRFFSGIDELGWFPNSVAADKNVKMNAREVYTAIERSLLTVRAAAMNLMRRGFYDTPTGYFVNISSPSSIRDKITDLVRLSIGSRKIYGLNKPTWDMNPKITREDLEEEFRKDPANAMRDYGAQPPLSSNPFISSQAAVEDCYMTRKNLLHLKFDVATARDRTKERYAKAIKIKGNGIPAVLALDAGYSNNSFAGAVVYAHPKTGMLTAGLLFEVPPLPGIPINHGLLYKHLLNQVFEAFNIKMIVADRWNSLKLLSDAEIEHDCAKLLHSLTYQEMVTFKQYILDGEFQFPKPEKTMEEILAFSTDDYPQCFENRPADHLVLQALTVQNTGSQVIKGDNLTDDIFRSVMLGGTIILSEKYAEYFQGPVEETKAPRQDASTMVFMKTMSGVSNKEASMPTNVVASPRALVRTRR